MTLGKSVGEKTVTLTEAQMPSHIHSVSQVAFVDRRASSTVAGSSNAEGVVNNQAGKNTSATGNGQPHNNLQPSRVVNYIIKS